jgi:mannobiose 2-epimerase
MFEATGHVEYQDLFARTLAWIQKTQTDWRFGDWHWRIPRFRRPLRPKSGPWKTPYHNGRALLESLEKLEYRSTWSAVASLS